MPNVDPLPANDLVSRTISHLLHARGAHPVPLTATSYDIAIRGGLADLTCTRTFRNVEAQSIRGDAVVSAARACGAACIGGRALKGPPRPRRCGHPRRPLGFDEFAVRLRRPTQQARRRAARLERDRCETET